MILLSKFALFEDPLLTLIPGCIKYKGLQLLDEVSFGLLALDPFPAPNCSNHLFLPVQVFPTIEKRYCPFHYFETFLIIFSDIKTLMGSSKNGCIDAPIQIWYLLICKRSHIMASSSN